MKTFLSTEVAHGLQIKHGKLVRDLNRVRSMMPPDFASEAMTLGTITNARGIERRCYRLSAAALPFLFMGQATKTQVLWMVGVCGGISEDRDALFRFILYDREIDAHPDEAFEDMTDPKATWNTVCRVCGCSWFNACSGGCSWVEDDLCSACAAEEKTKK